MPNLENGTAQQSITMKRIKFYFSFLFLFCALSSIQCFALEINRYVRSGATGRGTSWEDACGSIQKAVEDVKIAGKGTINVAAGTYHESIWIHNGMNGVKLIGGYPANGIGERDWEENKTIINSRNYKMCILVDAFCQKNLIDGFYLQNGATGDITLDKREIYYGKAGGINVQGKENKIVNCIVSGCSNLGIYLAETNYLDDSSVIGCDRGIYAMNQCFIRNSDFLYNKAYGMNLIGAYAWNCCISGNNGVGVKMFNSVISFCFIYNNLSAGTGGGVYADGRDNTIYGSVIYNNTAAVGGGIYLQGNLTVESSTIVNNKATREAGGVGGSQSVTPYFSMAGVILWNNKCRNVNSEYVLQNGHPNFFNSAIEGGGIMPELDKEKGIIDLPSKNIDPIKPSVNFKKICNIVGASRDKLQIQQIEDQNFRLSDNSVCIGNGGYFADAEPDFSPLDRTRTLAGKRENDIYNIGAY